MMPVSVSAAELCAAEIARAQERVNSYLEYIADTGTRARESVRATTHRQPTPATLAAAEAALGELDPSVYGRIMSALSTARAFDRQGDEVSCSTAVQEVDRIVLSGSRCGRSSC
jgi:hypothetical protein